ncbi:MAG: hypothetical protein JWP95_176 [Actinotalea sp.]|nr:hypothetical protein [Actinotalea sp.]
MSGNIERAPLGHPAEAEPPQHSPDPDAAPSSPAVEDSTGYELAVEDGLPLSSQEGDDPDQADGGAGAPEFREPGAR